MKDSFVLLFVFFTSLSYSQTTYFTTDGKNKLTELEIISIKSKLESNMTKVSGKKYYASLTVEYTETKEDSLISKVSFILSVKKSEDLILKVPLTKFIETELPQFDFKALNGEPTLINFWFAKCVPCIEEMPILNKIAEKYKDDFNFVSITFEKVKDVEKFLKKHSFNFKHLIDAEEFTELIGIKSFPVNLFLDKHGILKVIKGGIPFEDSDGKGIKIGDGKEIIEIIERLK